MADQVVPITDIASTGVIKDTPSISLPPNAYSDVQNVRFHSGAVRKMEGEMPVTLGAHTNIAYAVYWQAPSNNYYVVVQTDGDVVVYNTDALTEDIAAGTMVVTGGTPIWQHTLFNGGFNLILNNGVDAPHYLSDPVMENNLTRLPNWDSYLAQEDVTSVVWDHFNDDIELGRAFDPAIETLLYTVTPRDTSIGIINYELAMFPHDGDTPFNIQRIPDDSVDDDKDLLVFITPRRRTEEQTGALPGDLITISVRTNASINVRAGVIRAYGNLLVAGNLTETDPDDSSIVRRLPGTIRTSDVAAPGAIPLNWNPFRNGANTADEFILSSTGVVQDMAELQGVMYVYTDVSIHGIQQTGNEVIPFQISTVTDSYGCNSLGAVMEFDGRHLVVGSQDIYVFAGHPGSIASIADQRVRHYAYSPSGGIDGASLDISNIRMVRSQKYDEIWLFTPSLADNMEEMLVWNYRSQAWTIRKQSNVLSGTQGIDSPLFANATKVFEGDKTFSDVADVGYESFVARRRLGLTPEFDTETLGATAIMFTADNDDMVNLEIRMSGTETPSDEKGLDDGEFKVFKFNGHSVPDGQQADYKVDTRIHGRFINYKISDMSIIDGVDTFTSEPWNITGYQLEIMKGGKR